MTRPPLEIHRLIEHLMRNPDARDEYAAKPELLLDIFAVPSDQREDLLSGTQDAWHRIGIHPNMQFKLLSALGRSPLPPFSLDCYLDRLPRDDGDG